MATEGGYTLHLSAHVAEVGASQKAFDTSALLTTPHAPHEPHEPHEKSEKSGRIGRKKAAKAERPAPNRVVGERWSGHPVQAAALRAFAVAVPIAAAVGSSIVFSHILPYPRRFAAVALWWIAMFAASSVVLMVVDRWARRLLPLAALLKLSMLFPDQAPSRFGVALKAGTVKNLEERIEQVRLHGVDDKPAQAARQILELVGMLNAHDPQTRGHSERVRAFSGLLGAELKLSQDDRDRLHWAALLHDVGKVMVPHEILHKAGKPDDDEWARLHRHPEDGDRLATPLRGWLGPWADTIVQHHEKWDGSGYPHHLAGEDISLGARIVSVADAFEVMTAVRSYKGSMDVKAAREELIACSGTHFDPAMVRAFLNVSMGKMRWTAGPLAWFGQLPFLRGMGGAGGGLPAQVAVAAGRTLAGVAVFAGVATPTHVPPKPEPKASFAAAIPAAPGATVPASTANRGKTASTPNAGGASAPTSPGTTTAPSRLIAGSDPVPTTAAPRPTVPNRPPVAREDAISTGPHTPRTLDVTANDSDPDGNLQMPIVVLDQPGPVHANLTSGGHVVNIVPDNSPPGVFQFHYRLCDTQNSCVTTTVTVTITS